MKKKEEMIAFRYHLIVLKDKQIIGAHLIPADTNTARNAGMATLELGKKKLTIRWENSGWFFEKI